MPLEDQQEEKTISLKDRWKNFRNRHVAGLQVLLDNALERARTLIEQFTNEKEDLAVKIKKLEAIDRLIEQTMIDAEATMGRLVERRKSKYFLKFIPAAFVTSLAVAGIAGMILSPPAILLGALLVLFPPVATLAATWYQVTQRNHKVAEALESKIKKENPQLCKVQNELSSLYDLVLQAQCDIENNPGVVQHIIASPSLSYDAHALRDFLLKPGRNKLCDIFEEAGIKIRPEVQKKPKSSETTRVNPEFWASKQRKR